jgi:hypothetical protein
MNRLEMAEEIAKRVPMLAQRDKDEWKAAEQVRAAFVADYPTKKLSVLALDEYVIGKGAQNRSFCYRLEREMDTLGKILGATAFQFGVYFGRTKSEPTYEYRFRPHWGDTLDEAFSAVKQAIVDLLQAATKEDSAAIAANALSLMFKGKLLFLYHPDQFAPIYSEEHLEHFIAELDLSGSFECGADMQRALMEYRATWPELLAQPSALYMRLLYDIFGYPQEDDSSETASNNVPMLDEAVKGAQFIHEMPALPIDARPRTEHQGRLDYDTQARRLKRIGDRGEALVVALEKQRLIQASKPELAARIKHVSEKNDSEGFDILSFDENGADRPIEVKATTGKNLDRGFYLTHNELEKAGALPNYHLYIVFSAMSKHPQILPLKQPALNGVDFVLRPVAYHVSLSEKVTL